MSVTSPIDGKVCVDSPYVRIEDTGEAIPLRDKVTTVGRGLGVDIRLDDPSVSTLHAEIVRRGPYFYLADLGLSRNGTQVNGDDIGTGTEVPLHSGDRVCLGAWTVLTIESN